MGMKVKYGPADYEARLNGGVILWKGIPCRVSIDAHEININDLVSNRSIVRGVDPLHEDLDISAFELGFMNTPTHAIYLERIPRRRYKQALEAASVVETALRRAGPRAEVNMGRGGAIFTDEFRKTFTKAYPTFDQAVALLTEEDTEVESVAVSRKIALTADEFGRLTVWHKSREGDSPVGWVDPGSRVVRVPSTEKAWIISMYFAELGWEYD